jgi:hypothetical protein
MTWLEIILSIICIVLIVAIIILYLLFSLVGKVFHDYTNKMLWRR